MSTRAIALRQDRMTQILVLSETLIERDHFEVDRLSKSRQVGVVPDLRGKRLVLGERSPDRFDSRRFFDVANTWGRRRVRHRLARLAEASLRHFPSPGDWKPTAEIPSGSIGKNNTALAQSN